MFNSSVSNVGSITFPKFKPERIYMQKFFKKSGLPKEYRHWQDTVDQMLEKVDTDQPIYLMVDSAHVKANTRHRREGLHIDGYWIDRDFYQFHGGSSHGGGGSSHSGSDRPDIYRDNSSHSGTTTVYVDYKRDRRYSKNDPYVRNHHGVIVGINEHNQHFKPRKNTHGMIIGWDDLRPKHEIPKYDSHGNLIRMDGDNDGQKVIISEDWANATLQIPEALVLASNYTSSRGFVGQWEGVIGDGGACEHIDVSGLKEVVLEKNNVYISNVGFLHESLPVQEDIERTLVRLNVKNWEYS